MPSEQSQKKILVIRLGAFGDIILAMGAFRTIRSYHSADHLTILTTEPYHNLLRESGYFDEVIIDQKPKFWQLVPWIKFLWFIINEKFDRIYDLQRNQRTRVLYHTLKLFHKFEWSGIIKGSSHYIEDDPSSEQHVLERWQNQLAVAGLNSYQSVDLQWLISHNNPIVIKKPYVLIVAGSASKRPEKRAKADLFIKFCHYLKKINITVVLLGTQQEKEQIDTITRECSNVINLIDKTTFKDIATLAKNALGAIGNDTGTMHLIAAVNCPSLILYSHHSNPKKILPSGTKVSYIVKKEDMDLTVDDVIKAWKKIIL
jgi:ADP-heptose:LPS heptosyltransferase